MYAKILKWVEAIVLTVGSLAALVVLLMLIRYMGDTLWSQEAAGWAQAIGSVIAIYSTFYLFQKQRRYEQKEVQDRYVLQEYEFARMLENIVMAAGEASTNAASKWAKQEECTAALARMDAMRGVLHSYLRPEQGLDLQPTLLEIDRLMVEVQPIYASEFSEARKIESEKIQKQIYDWIAGFVGRVQMKGEEVNARGVSGRV